MISIELDFDFLQASGEAIWEAGTSGHGLYMLLTYPGELVILDQQQHRQWAAGADMGGGEVARLHGDGSLLLYDWYGDVMWSNMAAAGDNTWCRSMLWESVQLLSGEALCSANLQYKAVMNADGNLAIYKMVGLSS